MKELLHTLAMFRHIDKDEMESVEYKEELRLKAEAAAKEAGLSLEGEKKREKSDSCRHRRWLSTSERQPALFY